MRKNLYIYAGGHEMKLSHARRYSLLRRGGTCLVERQPVRPPRRLCMHFKKEVTIMSAFDKYQTEYPMPRAAAQPLVLMDEDSARAFRLTMLMRSMLMRMPMHMCGMQTFVNIR